MADFFRRFSAIGFVLAGSLVFFVSSLLQSGGNFPDPDSFYHARMAMEIRDHGIVHDFPWLTQTVFADSYVDHHFLYHLILIPFVSLPDPFLGMRLAAVIFGMAAIIGAALLLRAWGVAGAPLAAVFLTVSNPFIFRMNLAKTPSLSILMVLWGLWAASRGRAWLLGVIAFVYVWLYDGWPILLVAVALVILGEAMAFLDVKRLFSRRNRLLVEGTVLGLLVGHLVNPYFPENLAFEWLHIVRIGFIGFREQFGVGQEWYPWNPLELLAASGTTFLLILGAAVAALVASLAPAASRRAVPRARAAQTLALALLAAIAYVFTLKAKRNVEYFVPFAVLFSFSAIDCARRLAPAGWFRDWVNSLRRMPRSALTVVAVFFALLLPILVVRDVRGAIKDFETGIPPDKYQKVSAWLTANTPEGAVIFHNDWDDFPYFFIHNTHNRYLVGLDPAFMYVKNQKRFSEWVEITQGRDTVSLVERIIRDFGAEYAFVDTDHRALDAALAADGRARLVYQDDEGKIYRLGPIPAPSSGAPHD